MEDQATKISVEEQTQLTTIQTFESDLTSGFLSIMFTIYIYILKQNLSFLLVLILSLFFFLNSFFSF